MWPLSISKIPTKENDLNDRSHFDYIYRAFEYLFVYWTPLFCFFLGIIVTILGIAQLFIIATTTSNELIKLICYIFGTIICLFMVVFSMCFGRLLALKD